LYANLLLLVTQTKVNNFIYLFSIDILKFSKRGVWILLYS